MSLPFAVAPTLKTLRAYAQTQGFRVDADVDYAGRYTVLKLRAAHSDQILMSIAPYISEGADRDRYFVDYSFLSTGTKFALFGRTRYTDPKRSIASVKRSMRRLRVSIYGQES